MKSLRALSCVIYMLVACWCFAPTNAQAATCGGGLNPILIITTPLVFADYNANLSVHLTVNATITITCTIVLATTLPSFTVSLSTGLANSYTPRKMAWSSNRLNYNLYTSAAYNTIWGDGVTGGTGVQSYSTADDLSLKSFTVFGRIDSRQYVAAGIYGDTVNVTVTY